MKPSLNNTVFIINPHSGRRNADRVVRTLLQMYPHIHYFVSNTLEELDRFFYSEIHKYKVAVICGGDGTVNSTLKHLTENKELSIAILPNGSGDGFARELGYKKNIQRLVEQIDKGTTEKIDLVKVNNEYSCNMIGLGFDSYIAAQFEKSSSRGLRTYAYHTLIALTKYKPIEAEIILNDSVIKGNFMMINIANTRQFGNNAIIAPQAKYNDKLLDIVLVKPIPVTLLPLFIYRIFAGKLKESKYVQFIKTNEAIIKSNSETYHLDGEAKKMNKALNISIDRQFKAIKT